MILWHIDALVDELRTRAVTPGEVLGYIAAYLVPGMLFELFPLEISEPSRVDVAIQFAINLVVLGGIGVAYVANGGAAGRDFAGRLLAISWVVGLRTAVVGTLAMVVAIVVIAGTAAFRGIEPPAASILPPLVATFMLACTVGLFWRVSHHLKSLAR